MPHESRGEERFDSCYRSTRRAVLLQVFVLTGDLPVAQTAVRDAYLRAWQRWRTVSQLDDPLDWVRPRAWQLAQRRHRLRPSYRGAVAPDQQRAVLDALGRLSAPQRRAVLLVELAGLDLDTAARELHLSREEAESAHRQGTGSLTTELDIPASALAARLAALDTLLDDAPMPRATRLRRTGRRRRRNQFALGATAATVVAVAVGALASQPQRTSAEELGLVRPSEPTRSAEPASRMPTAEDLLYAEQMTRFGPSRSWRATRTGNNTTGDGINTVCQADRFADPKGYAALVRSFRAEGTPRRSAVQTVEVSRSPAAASRAFERTVGWYAGCERARLQVLDAFHVGHVGDQADVLTLRIGRKPVTTVSVAVGRTGAVTTSTVGTSFGGSPPPTEQVAHSLADAVKKLCARTGSPGCVGTPTFHAVPPPPTGDERGLLAVADLPPVGRIDDPWVGTEPVSPVKNPAMTSCDEAAFASAGATRRRSRTYLIPQAPLPARFGLAETYGRFRTPRAAAGFLSDVRRRVAGCEKRDLATEVVSARDRRTPRTDRSMWKLTTEVAKGEKVRFRVGLVRVGRRVAQVTFAPGEKDDMTDRAFDGLVVRSGQRLRELR